MHYKIKHKINRLFLIKIESWLTIEVKFEEFLEMNEADQVARSGSEKRVV